MDKMVPKVRFKGFTDDWELCKLSDMVKITMGQSPSSKNYTNNSEDYILVQGNADLKNGYVDINRGRAGLNVTYPNMSMKDSVAMHELGHALGLGHSSYTNSVMYPVDQGVSKLSEADLNGLRNIYK